MNQREAFRVLNLSGDITPDMVKKAYRLLTAKYHPDRNPNGHHMQQMLNEAYAAVKDFEGHSDLESDTSETEYHEDIAQALNAIMGLGLNIEVCGSWVWVSGDTRPHKDVLKLAGFRWAPVKKLWHFRPNDFKSSSRGKMGMDDIRMKYGTLRPGKGRERERVGV